MTKEYRKYQERLEAVRRLASDPRTPANEAAAAQEALKRMKQKETLEPQKPVWTYFYPKTQFEHQTLIYCCYYITKRDLRIQPVQNGFAFKITPDEEQQVRELYAELGPTVEAEYNLEAHDLRVEIEALQTKLQNLPSQLTARYLERKAYQRYYDDLNTHPHN